MHKITYYVQITIIHIFSKTWELLHRVIISVASRSGQLQLN